MLNCNGGTIRVDLKDAMRHYDHPYAQFRDLFICCRRLSGMRLVGLPGRRSLENVAQTLRTGI